VKKLIYLVAGARSNLMKIAPIIRALQQAGTDPVVITQTAQTTLQGDTKQGQRPAPWDGQAAQRIVERLGVILG